MPVMIVVAGVNGAGKSSTIGEKQKIDYINPDQISKYMQERHPESGPLGAMKEVLRQIEEKLDTKANFAMETTLAGKNSLNIMRRAKAAGFDIKLRYVVLDNLERHFERVATRVSRGGHDIAREDIERRFRTSFENLPKAMALSDQVAIYDNTHVLKPLLLLDHGKIVLEEKRMPAQLKSHIYEPQELILKDLQEERVFRTEIVLKRFGEKDAETQKKEAAMAFARHIGPNSGKLAARFEALSEERAGQLLEYAIQKNPDL